MSRPSFYITTAIDYVNAEPHMGHAYEKIGADAMARYKRLRGCDVLYTIGTDEHGQKVAEAAESQGIEPQAHADRLAARFQETWKKLEISHDDFIRTTEARHHRTVTALFERIQSAGDLYEGDYVGWYCKYEETFWPETKLVNGKCPTCSRDVEKIAERNVFFRLSRYTQPLIEHFEAHPDFVLPTFRRQEMMNILREGLEDLSISRAKLKWGIPLPGSEHVLYVWFDALINYVTSAGFPDDEGRFQRYWPADHHVIGKDIVKFHSIIWPAMLLSGGLPLPRHIFVHGFVMTPSGKMSKSVGNVISPLDIADRYGPDTLRYALLREIAWGHDGVMSEEILRNRYNRDLGNDLGNLLHRVASMIERHFDGVVPSPPEGARTELEEGLDSAAREAAVGAGSAYDEMAFNQALEAAWGLVRAGNQYVDRAEPWKWAAGKPGDAATAGLTPEAARELERANPPEPERARARLATVLASGAEALRKVSVLLAPVIPSTCARIRTALGISQEPAWSELDAAGTPTAGNRVEKGQPLFPRLEELGEPAAAPVPPPAKEKAAKGKKDAGPAAEITFQEFSRAELRVGRVITARRVEGADKLLALEVCLGAEVRQIVAGIAQSYSPEELVDRRVVVVANLEPAEIRGVRSQGMLLAATGPDGKHHVVTPDALVPEGTRVK